jgi:hypothetical protein
MPAGKRVRAIVLLCAAAACAGFTQTSSAGLPASSLSSLSVFPNPFDCRKTAASIAFTLAGACGVDIKIFSVAGALLREFSFPAAAGGNVVTWDGAAGSGQKVPKGVYLAVISAGGAQQTLKIGVIH